MEELPLGDDWQQPLGGVALEATRALAEAAAAERARHVRRGPDDWTALEGCAQQLSEALRSLPSPAEVRCPA